MNPKKHPNGYVTLTVASVGSFIVYEAQKRGLALDDYEASMIVGCVAAAFHFAARYIGGAK